MEVITLYIFAGIPGNWNSSSSGCHCSLNFSHNSGISNKFLHTSLSI